MSLMARRNSYKPFKYPWAYEAFVQQNRMHWLWEEVPLAEDVRDWSSDTLSDGDRSLLTHIFRFFTQADSEVSDNYNTRLAAVFRPPEVQMMLSSFANMEGVHMAAYSMLVDTLGMPETTYSQFLDYKAMKDKHDYFSTFSIEDPREIAKTLAAFGGFVEGVQLFASFAILMNFNRRIEDIGKPATMKGMGTIVEYSIKDETLHTQSMIKLYRAFVGEHRGLLDDSLKSDIYTIAETMVEHEDAFVDLAFEMGDVKGLQPAEVKQYVRYIAGRRLLEMGLKNIFGVKRNPLEWLDYILNGKKHTNFFEGRETGYARGALGGSWEDAWQIHS